MPPLHSWAMVEAPEPPGGKTDVAKMVTAAPVIEKKSLKADQALLMSEIQLLLAERRTAFAQLRTGISISLVPLSIWTVLIATSRLWDPFHVWWLLSPIMILAALLLALGIYLIDGALRTMRHTDQALHKVRGSDTLLEDLLYHAHWREEDDGYLRGLGRRLRFRRAARHGSGSKSAR